MNLTVRRDMEVIQILQGDTILFTICEPTGPGRGEIGIFEGTGLDENDEDLAPLKVIYCSPPRDAEKEALKVAIEMAYIKVDF